MCVASHISILTRVIVVALAFTPGLTRAEQAKPSDECPNSAPTFRVGHKIKDLNVTGTFGETVPLKVQVWYPAREQDDCDEATGFEQGPGGCHAPPAVYTSRLYGDPRVSALQWSPLSWTVLSTIAFEDARIARGDDRFPVIVFSHGNDNNAIDHAYLLEALASYGYIVAAPDHINNTQDDVRIDFVNTAARAALPEFPCVNGVPGSRCLIPCLDGTPSPCSTPDVARTMVDRVREVGAILDALPTWFGHRVDVDKVGIMGHSRGSVTSLAVAGGSTYWGIRPDPRFKAVLGLSIGAQPVASHVDFQNISVPTLLVSGTKEPTGLQTESAAAFAAMTYLGVDKQRVVIKNATHRHFDSALCPQVQSSASVAESDSKAMLDLHTVKQNTIVNVGNGVAMDFCAYDTFFDPPTDIRPLIASLTGFDVTPGNVPTTGLTSSAVEEQVLGLAVSFFGRVLNRADGDARPFSDCLPDEFKNQPSAPDTSQPVDNGAGSDDDGG